MTRCTHTLVVHTPTTFSQQCRHPAVAVPAELACQLHNLSCEHLFLFHIHRLAQVRGPRMPQYLAGPSLRDSEGLLNVLNTLTTTGWVQKFPSTASLSIWLSNVNSATAFLSAMPGLSSAPRTPYATGRRSAASLLPGDWSQPPYCPPDIATSASLSLLITGSRVCFLLAISPPFYMAQD